MGKKPKPRLFDPFAGEVIQYDVGRSDLDRAERNTIKNNLVRPSPYWFGPCDMPSEWVPCHKCPKYVPRYYRRRGWCEDCLLHEWWLSLESFGTRKQLGWGTIGWASQLERLRTATRWLGIDVELVKAILARVDWLAMEPEEQKEKDAEKRLSVFEMAAIENLQDRPLAGIDTETLKAEEALFDLTGWINEDDTPALEVKRRLYFTKILMGLTGVAVDELQAFELRNLILEVCCDLQAAGVEPNIPEDYTENPYPD